MKKHKYSIGNCHACGHKEIIPHIAPYDREHKFCVMCGARIKYSIIESDEEIKTGWDAGIRRYHQNNTPIR